MNMQLVEKMEKCRVFRIYSRGYMDETRHCNSLYVLFHSHKFTMQFHHFKLQKYKSNVLLNQMDLLFLLLVHRE